MSVTVLAKLWKGSLRAALSRAAGERASAATSPAPNCRCSSSSSSSWGFGCLDVSCSAVPALACSHCFALRRARRSAWTSLAAWERIFLMAAAEVASPGREATMNCTDPVTDSFGALTGITGKVEAPFFPWLDDSSAVAGLGWGFHARIFIFGRGQSACV